MEAAEQSRAYHIEGAHQAAAMEHILRPWLLLACAHDGRRLTDLAGELGVPLAKLHYHAGRLVECGLLRVDRIESRRGRPIKYYRAIAQVFTVSLADVSEQVSEGLTRELRRSISQLANRRGSHLRFYLDESKRARVSLVDPEGGKLTQRALDHWKVMRLTAEQCVSLAAELTAVIARYEKDSPDTGELFLVHAAFAPKLAL